MKKIQKVANFLQFNKKLTKTAEKYPDLSPAIVLLRKRVLAKIASNYKEYVEKTEDPKLTKEEYKARFGPSKEKPSEKKEPRVLRPVGVRRTTLRGPAGGQAPARRY